MASANSPGTAETWPQWRYSRGEKGGCVDAQARFPLLIEPCVSAPSIIIMRIIGSAPTGPLAARMPG